MGASLPIEVAPSPVQIPHSGIIYRVYVRDRATLERIRHELETRLYFMHESYVDARQGYVQVQVRDPWRQTLLSIWVDSMIDTGQIERFEVLRDDRDTTYVDSITALSDAPSNIPASGVDTYLVVAYPSKPIICPVGCEYCYAHDMHKSSGKLTSDLFRLDEVVRYVDSLLSRTRKNRSVYVSVGIGGSVDPTLIEDLDEALPWLVGSLRDVANRHVARVGNVEIYVTMSTSNPDFSSVAHLLELAYRHSMLVNTSEDVYAYVSNVGVTVHDPYTFSLVRSARELYRDYYEYLSERISLTNTYQGVARPMVIIHGKYMEYRQVYRAVFSIGIDTILLSAHPPLPKPGPEVLLLALLDVHTMGRGVAMIDACMTNTLFPYDVNGMELKYVHRCVGGRCGPAGICPRHRPNCIYPYTGIHRIAKSLADAGS